MKDNELQFRTRARVTETRGGHALTFGFRLGPLAVFVIANLPEDVKSKTGPLVYVKLNLRVVNDWEESTSDDG